jgi:hypothetical protein
MPAALRMRPWLLVPALTSEGLCTLDLGGIIQLQLGYQRTSCQSRALVHLATARQAKTVMLPILKTSTPMPHPAHERVNAWCLQQLPSIAQTRKAQIGCTLSLPLTWKLMTPAAGLAMVWIIFMTSISAKAWPSTTCSPSCTSWRTSLPGDCGHTICNTTTSHITMPTS